ncbi:Cobalamin-5-phosphate synthase, CobS [Alkalihalophilus pseudofirmus OF4]|uniref:Adenosylcobinamide-GDP ribazoletransferase n=1 Tax=Alkalihalophilus pseudofirmus (strain ATCC BAA-2126 / JCM 17055 / OF4) TaxID=398511 RepID=D3FZY9_ALKPO|nr:adenosylcobinamide-GDP ribazoletransferase [Alkalihalophilus pseudofirmus]ADC51074.1 Cobalamin-5-phosphate synthase, CobS [Alkalihalophilus pseudofirmus OF4]
MESIKNLVKGALLAFQLLTTIPIPMQLGWNERLARISVCFYPLTGLVLGGLLGGQAYLLVQYTNLSSLIIAAWLLTFTCIYSGALHLDGWADFSDAVFSRQSIDRKLEIMKDSRVGAFGVISLLFLLGWRFLFIYEVIEASLSVYWLILIPFLTRIIMGSQILLGSFARNNGMAAALKPAQTTSVKLVFFSWVTAALIAFLTLDFTSVWLVLLALLFLIGWLRFSYKQINGITGDTIGAGTEGSETFLWAVLFVLYSFGMV